MVNEDADEFYSENLAQEVTRGMRETASRGFFLRSKAPFGYKRAGMERRGTPLGEADLRIGAIALSRGLTVVTGNVRHFQRIPDLSVENWL